MISVIEGSWKSTVPIQQGTVVLEESPLLKSPTEFPAPWKKLAKKIMKLEPDRKPDETSDTMPSWNQVSLNEATIRLLFFLDSAKPEILRCILEMANREDNSDDTPFASLLKKARVLILKEGPKLGMKKATLSNLEALLFLLTTKVCVTTDGGVVLFRKLGSIPHCCAPNCMFIPRKGDVGQLVAIRDIEVGEEINCSHIPTNCLRACVSTRQAWLRGVAGSKCRSACCCTGYDMRRRVICAKCHQSDASGDAKENICFAARSIETGKWKGLKCGEEMLDSEAINLGKETALIRKIHILNEAEVDLPRLAQYTKLAISDALKSFGKGHFCYQQLQLLNCGIFLHEMCAAGPSKAAFISWINMVGEIVDFSVETNLPFQGMDELVRIVLAPETLQMVIKLMGGIKKASSDGEEIVFAMSTFAKFVEESCACLVMIEGEDSVHAQDGLKLMNWFSKKFRNWLLAPPESPSSLSTAAPESVTTSAESCAVMQPSSGQLMPLAAVLLGLAASGLVVYTLYKKRN